jgi:hypothetical protein
VVAHLKTATAPQKKAARSGTDVVDRRHAMPPSERDERVALAVEKRIALDDERASSLIAKGLEGAAKSGALLDCSTTRRRPSACAAARTSSA